MDPATHEFETASEEAKEHLSQAGHKATEAVRGKMDEMHEKAASYYRQGREKAQQLHENAQSMIKEQPVVSVIVAAAVGLLAGMFLGRAVSGSGSSEE